MSLRTVGRLHKNAQTFNMTPIIDIVFLLIIFFLVVCQFIEAENFPVIVPDDCEFAETSPERIGQATTVTVMQTSEGQAVFAVGSEKITFSNQPDLADELALLIDTHLKDLPRNRRIVTLRIDRDICFARTQYALAGIAASSATDIRLAAVRDKRLDLQ